MIRRDRNVFPIPKGLVAPGGAGQRELARVKRWIDARRKGKCPPLTAYKDPEVAVALERLFESKCAYCGSLYRITQPVDVEHWRPKARVKGAGKGGPKRKRDYAWLAMDWDNLLPSCIRCNRLNRQYAWRTDAAGRWALVKVVLGKGDQFPVADETNRALHYNDDLGCEVPLLVHPCLDDPAEHYHFEASGIVRPRDLAPQDPVAALRRERAWRSIEVYALNRMDLVTERRERIVLLQARFSLIRSLAELVGRQKGQGLLHEARLIRQLVSAELDQLRALTESHRPYALMMGQFVHGFLQELKGRGRTAL